LHASTKGNRWTRPRTLLPAGLLKRGASVLEDGPQITGLPVSANDHGVLKREDAARLQRGGVHRCTTIARPGPHALPKVLDEMPDRRPR